MDIFHLAHPLDATSQHLRMLSCCSLKIVLLWKPYFKFLCSSFLGLLCSQYGIKVTVALGIHLFSCEENVSLHIFVSFLSELATNGLKTILSLGKKNEAKWILATRSKTCIYSYFLPRNGWKSKTEAAVSHFSMS